MHHPNRFILLLCLFLMGIFLYSGCSSSSNLIRYNTSSGTKKENNTAVRYGSEDKQENSNNIDTLEVSSDTSDYDDIPANTSKIDISAILKKFGASSDMKKIGSNANTERERMLMEIIKYLDTPYKYGGTSKNGIDCSAYTQAVYSHALSINLDRSARAQYHEGDAVKSKADLQFGDLVFFNTRRRVKPGHVGIYIGDDLFTHASSRNGVTVSSLDDSYYRKRYMGARRITDLAGNEKISSGN